MGSARAVVTGLGDYGLTLKGLGELGSRSVRIGVTFAGPSLTRGFVALKPSERLAEMQRRNREALHRARLRWPAGDLRRVGGKRYPRGFEVTLAARNVPKLVRDRSFSFVDVRSVEGRSRRAARGRAIEEWYAVRGRVAIQIEGHRKGLQTVEDRIVLVKALDGDDAVKRLRREWTEYARPYLNPRAERVRWRLEAVVDVYSTMEIELDPKGVEVYSKLTNRRIRASNRWEPGTPKGKLVRPWQ